MYVEPQTGPKKLTYKKKPVQNFQTRLKILNWFEKKLEPRTKLN